MILTILRKFSLAMPKHKNSAVAIRFIKLFNSAESLQFDDLEPSHNLINPDEKLLRIKAHKKLLGEKILADKDIQEALSTMMSVSWIKQEVDEE